MATKSLVLFQSAGRAIHQSQLLSEIGSDRSQPKSGNDTLVKNRPFYDQGILKIVRFDSIRLHLGQKYGISLAKCARLAGRSTVKSRELSPLANMSASGSQHAVESHRRWRVRLPKTHSNGPGSSTSWLSSRRNVPEMSTRQSATMSC